MLSLPDVTLIAVDGHIKLAHEAMEKCRDKANFGDCVLVPLDISYSTFCLTKMAQYINTSHALIVQYDSWIIYPECWTAEFLQYDYIGAKWPHHGNKVGNGGFSLRSKRLLDILSAWDYRQEVMIEDDFVCREIRHDLETKHGIKFAPEHIADKFSYERSQPDGKTFGFHGLYNIWRHVDDGEMIRMATLFPDYVVNKTEYRELIKIYLNLRKFSVVEALEARLR